MWQNKIKEISVIWIFLRDRMEDALNHEEEANNHSNPYAVRDVEFKIVSPFHKYAICFGEVPGDSYKVSCGIFRIILIQIEKKISQ